MYTYSTHIKQRMLERNFSEDEISDILAKHVTVIILDSDRDQTVSVYLAKVKSRYISLFVNKITKKLITIRNMRKAEKKYFEEVVYDKNKIR